MGNMTQEASKFLEPLSLYQKGRASLVQFAFWIIHLSCPTGFQGVCTLELLPPRVAANPLL